MPVLNRDFATIDVAAVSTKWQVKRYPITHCRTFSKCVPPLLIRLVIIILSDNGQILDDSL